jgi:hypothetical protein
VEKTNEVISPIAPLDLTVFRVVLTLDETQNGAFHSMGDIWCHEFVAVAPASQLAYGINVVLEPVAVQRVASSGFSYKVEAVHDTCEKPSFLHGELPLKAVING